jgi:hypothetical protein
MVSVIKYMSVSLEDNLVNINDARNALSKPH